MLHQKAMYEIYVFQVSYHAIVGYLLCSINATIYEVKYMYTCNSHHPIKLEQLSLLIKECGTPLDTYQILRKLFGGWKYIRVSDTERIFSEYGIKVEH